MFVTSNIAKVNNSNNWIIKQGFFMMFFSHPYLAAQSALGVLFIILKIIQQALH
jgi:hypothetical protein